MTHPQDTTPANPAQVTEAMVERGVDAALKADIVPIEGQEGVRIDDYLKSPTAVEAVELGVTLTAKDENGNPRFHGFSDIRADELDDFRRAVLRPVVKAALTAAIGAGGQAVAWQYEAEVNGQWTPCLGRDHPIDRYASERDRQSARSQVRNVRSLYLHPAPSGQSVAEDAETLKARAASVLCEAGALCGWPEPNCNAREGAEALFKAGLLAIAHPVQPGWREPDGFTPYLWQCKDYADGWISYADKEEALAYQRDTGCLLRITYRPAAPQPKGE